MDHVDHRTRENESRREALKAIDARAHLPRYEGQPGRGDTNLGKWFSNSKHFFGGGSLEGLVAEMDDADVDRAVLVTAPGRHRAEGRGQGPFATSSGYEDRAFEELCEEIANAVSRYPSRLVGMAMIDPMSSAATRHVERAVLHHQFRGCAVMPALIGAPLSHPLYYSVFAKCAELRIPITVNVGMPGPMRRSSVQHPVDLETVALTFPELTLIATHVGHPWHDVVIDAMARLDNLYLMTSAWAPRYLPDTLVEFMNGHGAGKVMWGTDYPLLSFDRCLTEIATLDLDTGPRADFLWRTTLRLFWGPESAEQFA